MVSVIGAFVGISWISCLVGGLMSIAGLPLVLDKLTDKEKSLSE